MIATRVAEQDITRLGWIDYALMGTASVLAVFAGAMAVSANESVPILVSLVVGGTVLSALVQAFLSEKFARVVGGFVYFGVVLACLFSWRQVNQVLPNQVLAETRELAPAGFLLWMIVYGSFVSWRDQTLLFQAVPGIAIFGLVGCYDTYRPAPFLFFGFLLCLCTMFARAHARTMLMHAAESGYQSRVAQEAMASGDHLGAARWVEAIRKGPWKWVAGPEWALASAATVVLFSLLGAPVIQRSVSGVSGFVRINVPVPPPQQNQVAQLFSASQSQTGSVAVGRGPNRLTDTPVFLADMDVPRYMRASTYFTYNGIGWDIYRGRDLDGLGRPLRGVAEQSVEEIKDPITIEWEVERLGDRGNFLPAPGEVTSTNAPENLLLQNSDGTLSVVPRRIALPVVAGASVVSSGRIQPKDSATNLIRAMDAALSTERITDRVMEAVFQATNSGGTDYEKARLWQQFIEGQVKYNLNAAATPTGADPVEHFLFTSKEGYCDLFASAMVQGARSLNIPSRYVVGYLPDNDRNQEGRIIVRESDAHAWAELYFQDVGWVVFDATEGAQAVPGSERGAPNYRTPWYEQEWAKYALLIVGLGGVVAAIFFAYRNHLRELALIDPARRALNREYEAFVRVIAKTSGHGRPTSTTPDEYLRTAAPSLGEAAPTAEEINRRFVRLMYSSDLIDEESLAELRTRVKEFATQVSRRPSK